MADPAAIISTNAAGQPEVGPEVLILHKGLRNDKRRAVLGWNHQNDTPDGLRSGKIWCWVSEGGNFQVYDENFNRSDRPGEVRFCGVANFTMVRMFHPFWAQYGRAPRDMKPGDKRRCRAQYKRLMRQWRVRNNLPVSDDDESENPVQPDVPGAPGSRRRGRPAKRGRGGRAPRPRQVRRQPSPVIMGREEQIAGHTANSPWAVSDDECSDANEDFPLREVQRKKNGRLRLGEMGGHLTNLFGNNLTLENEPKAAPEDIETEMKEEDDALLHVSNTNTLTANPSNTRARSVSTPLLNPSISTSANQPQGETNVPDMLTANDSEFALPVLGGGDEMDFNELNNAIADDLNPSVVASGAAGNSNSFVQELEAAATAVEPETQVKTDNEDERVWEVCPIQPSNEVIVIDD